MKRAAFTRPFSVSRAPLRSVMTGARSHTFAGNVFECVPVHVPSTKPMQMTGRYATRNTQILITNSGIKRGAFNPWDYVHTAKPCLFVLTEIQEPVLPMLTK